MNGPTTTQAIMIGACLGAIYGLFYYQQYRRQFYWVASLAAGIISSVLAIQFIRLAGMDGFSLEGAALQLLIPSLATIGLNRMIAKKKRTKRPRRSGPEMISQGFTTIL